VPDLARWGIHTTNKPRTFCQGNMEDLIKNSGGFMKKKGGLKHTGARKVDSSRKNGFKTNE
jgi:hypothetical protein